MIALFWFTVRQNLRLRRLWFVLLLLTGPSGLALLIRYFGPSGRSHHLWDLYQGPILFVLLMAVLPLVCMLHGSTLIGAEVDGRTLVYLTTRRMRRETVLLVRVAAAWVALTALVELAVIAFHFCTLAGMDIDGSNAAAGLEAERAWNPAHDLLAYLRVIPLAVLVFLSLFTLISLVFRRPLIISIIYLVFVEMVASNAPVRAQIYTITHQVRQMLKASIPRLLSVLPPHHNRALIEPLYPPDATGYIPLIIIVAVTLMLACVAVRTRELVPARTG
jgi:ABC-2 type transport system permease protein